MSTSQEPPSNASSTTTGLRKGYNVDYPKVGDLSSEEKDELISALLEKMNLRIWRDRTPDYSEIVLIENKEQQT